MTTHQLATLFDHLGQGLGESLKAGAANELGELSSAFRELPDQTLKELVKRIRSISQPTGMSKGKVRVDLAEVIARIRAVREGQANGEPVPDLDGMKLNNTQLKEILKSFGIKPTATVAGNLTKVRELIRPGQPTNSGPTVDPETVDRGVELYNALLADRKLSIPDVRAGFEPFRSYSKAVIEEISRRVGYTPLGSQADILERLLTNLEGIKLSQHRADRILVGTGS